jgi:hypothetical protein|tara:strand:- start:400 stop:927 length:528 start_codon:yes stop_codon:yes gene_type:complete
MEFIMVVFGIDPGASGAIASYDGKTLDFVKCPSGGKDMADSVRSIIHGFEIKGIVRSDILVGFERVHAMPHDARNSAFKFGRNVGMWWGVLGSLGLDFIEIAPRTWQAHFLHKRIKVKKDRKNKLKEIAQNMFPDKKVTLINCDAILIAVYYYQTSQKEREENDRKTDTTISDRK